MSLGRRTEMVKVAQVARFVGVKPSEIRRMFEEDNFPHVRLPCEKDISYRIFLPDFHVWLLKWSKVCPCPKLENYEEFRRAFFDAQVVNIDGG